MTKPSIKTIQDCLQVDKGKAVLIRSILDKAVNNRTIEDALQELNTVLEGYGVESIRGEWWTNVYWLDCNLVYVNMGDTYIGTILYDPRTERFICSSWGDFVERHEKRFRDQ